VLQGEATLLSNVVYSQAEVHARYGGVVPEVASRNHIIKIAPVIRAALDGAGIGPEELDLIGATSGPGLIGPLLVGLTAAQGMAYALDLPFVGVNHLEGHLFAHRLSFPDAPPPFAALLVSGGHTSLIRVRDWGDYELLGTTRDDAAGEAFDKAGKLMNLGYPAGPQIDRLAQKGDPASISFPRPMLGEGFDFSFSGLKTAVRYYLGKHPDATLADVAASFQTAVVEVLADKLVRAAAHWGDESMVVVGGVAANSGLRAALAERAEREGKTVHFPALKLCLDNGAMIAACAQYRHAVLGEQSPRHLAAQPGLALG